MTRLQSPPSDISEQARNFQEWVNNVDAFLETCDGGDHGSPDAPSIWLLGLEPGWSLDDRRREGLGDGRSEELDYSVQRQLKWPFNRNAFKLLAALQGASLEKYKDFAQDKRPFEKGCTGYFKGNLFPVACSKMSAWDEGHTGRRLDSKLRTPIRTGCVRLASPLSGPGSRSAVPAWLFAVV